MASLVFIVPIVFFTTIGIVSVALFGWLLPTIAAATGAAWVNGVAMKAFLEMLLLVLGVVMPLASILTWMERRQSAMMQDRLGPNRANFTLPLLGNIKLAGILHFLADALKMLFKEDFIPAKANRLLFVLAPILAIAPAFVVFAIVPWGSGVCPGHLGEVLTDAQLAACLDEGGTRFQVAHIEVGMLFYFAIASLAVYGTTLAGWASYNKWSLLGGLRASSQMMSYEVAMGLALLGSFLIYGTLEPAGIVSWQGNNVLTWGIVVQPLGFLLFFAAAMAETKRAPFDLPEGEPEIIGYFVEYSGMRFGMFFLAEFIEVVFVAAMVTTLFFGGYNLPFLESNGIVAGGQVLLPLPHLVVAVLHVTVFGFKVFFFCWFQLLVRWTLPRLRPDQLMNLGWKGLLPLSIANLLVTAGVLLALASGHGKG